MPKPINRTMILPEEITREIETTLNETDRLVLTAWLDGKPKFEAWASVMRPGTVITASNERSIRTQASRFWNTMRLRSIADKIDEWKIDHGVAKNIKLKPNDKRQKIIIPSLPEQKPIEKTKSTQPPPSHEGNDSQPLGPKTEEKSGKKSTSQSLVKKRSYSEQRQAWLESFQDIENPSATTPYGIGLWLGSRVLAQVNKREQWIERHNISPMDKDGCPYTSTDISAVKTVLAALLPFAPAPTQQELKQLTTAGLIISLTAEEMGINPDEYVAPTPPGVKSHADDYIDTNAESQEDSLDED